MNTTIISAEINAEDVPMLKAIFKRIKAKKIVIKEKDDTKMTKDAYFAKINRAREQKGEKISVKEFEDRFLK